MSSAAPRCACPMGERPAKLQPLGPSYDVDTLSSHHIYEIYEEDERDGPTNSQRPGWVQGSGHRRADAGGVRRPVPTTSGQRLQSVDTVSSRSPRSVSRRSRRTAARSRWSLAGTSGPCRQPAAKLGCSWRTKRLSRVRSYSPEGDRIAFVSDRTGGGDIYVLTLKTGALEQLTMDDGLERLDAWSRDGRWLYFSSTSRDIAGMNDLYRVRADGGTPMLVSADRYTGEFFAAPSPDGQRVAFSARGNSSGQWWRKGHSHLDESELWILDTSSTGTNGGRPRPRLATSASPSAAPSRCGRCGAPTAAASSTCPIAAARRTSGRCRSAAPRSR